MKIYHNSRCSKSRQTLALIEENGVTPEIVNYLEDCPSKDELAAVLAKLDLPATKIIRFKEAIAKELGIKAKDDKTQDQWLDLIVANPKLLERPIVIKGDKAIIGRPPENVLKLV